MIKLGINRVISSAEKSYHGIQTILHIHCGKVLFACSLLDEETILVTRQMSQSGLFEGFHNMILPAGDEAAANALRINDTVLVSAEYKRTVNMLDQAGYSVVPVKTMEIEKIDAGLSCMSLRWFRK